jgi:hypothetical protein
VPTEWARRGFACARSRQRCGAGHRSQLLEGVEPNQEAAALALIQTTFRQALDLLENPEAASQGEAMMGLIKALHAAGKRYEWSVTEPDVHISGDIAWSIKGNVKINISPRPEVGA